MELLERYLYQIEKYLPKEDKKDTIDELKSFILDQLDSKTAMGENKEDELYKIIKETGSPKEVALRYRGDPPLISREMEPIIFMIFKILAYAIPIGILVGKTFEFIDKDEAFKFFEYLLHLALAIPSMISAFITGVGFVFIIFILIEKYAKEEIEKEFSHFEPNNLPKILDKKYKVSLFESLFTIIFSVVVLYILNYQTGIIAVYSDGVSQPLLNENFNQILILINISLFFTIALETFYIINKKKIFQTKVLEYLQKLFAVAIFTLLATTDIFNEIIIEGHNLAFLPKLFQVGMIIGLTVNFIVGTFVFINVVKDKMITLRINKRS